jgi:hypothetical protein
MDRKVATQSHERNFKGDGYDDKREKKKESIFKPLLEKLIMTDEAIPTTGERLSNGEEKNDK